ncbi:MAG: CPBP family intramembrane metalloprotease [Proteobacteria bacterium]|nr:CPBP family intramembrane metalloprotease [Pseudomonadota bacterium]
MPTQVLAPSIPWRRPILELGAVTATAAAHLALTSRPEAHLAFVVTAVLGWGAYTAHAALRDRERLRSWGFTRKGLVESFAVATPLALIVGTGMIGWGRLSGVGFDAWMLLPLALYPIWGVIQQFLVQGLLVKNLDEAGVHPGAVVALAAVAFGLVHWPYPVLMAATFGLGLVFTPLYLRFRNLWALGLLHGWLGTLLYQFVLNRHPIHEALGIASM